MLEASFLILSIVYLLLVLFAIPLVVQMWRAAKKMATALEELNESLPGILKNLEDITSNLGSTTDVINREMASFTLLGNKVRALLACSDAAERMLLNLLRTPLTETSRTVRAVIKGIGVFLHTYALLKSEDSAGSDKRCQK